MSRIVLDVSGEQHQKIKALAALQGKSIKDFVLEKVFPSDQDESQAMKALESLLSERISNAEASETTGKTFTQIADETLQNRQDI